MLFSTNKNVLHMPLGLRSFLQFLINGELREWKLWKCNFMENLYPNKMWLPKILQNKVYSPKFVNSWTANIRRKVDRRAISKQKRKRRKGQVIFAVSEIGFPKTCSKPAWGSCYFSQATQQYLYFNWDFSKTLRCVSTKATFCYLNISACYHEKKILATYVNSLFPLLLE